jgi:sphinganine-1-phosphate aldolase
MERMRIPESSRTVDEVLGLIEGYTQDDLDPVEGLAAGSPFATGRPEVEEVAQRAFMRFWDANAMYRRYFPSIERMERELVAMTGGLLNAPDGFSGVVSSGGSESILLAVKAARDATRRTRAHADTLVLSETAHPAFWKAAEYLDLAVRSVPLTPRLELNVEGVAAAVRDDVVLAVASAPSFVLGSVDPVEQVAAICQEHGVALHVDGCVGGFALPWLERLGVELPRFDFRVEGVTSMSADLHKYGFAPRGSSVMIARDSAWGDHSVFRYGSPPRPESWYTTPTVAGSRPAASIASAWAVMMHLGQSGYLELARDTRSVCDRIWSHLESVGLQTLGSPVWSLFTFSMGDGGSQTADLAAGLRTRGWLVHEDVFPQPLIRMMMAPGQFHRVDQYLSDMSEVVAAVRSGASFTGGPSAAYT